MKLSSLRLLDVGDEVNWIDPDNDCCTGTYFIKEIATDSGRVEDMDSALILSSPSGDIFEVYAVELV
jgi:hypothetical protein